MAKLAMVDGGVVYRNTNPGYEYTFACHSSLGEIAGSGELLCAYQRGQALYSVDSVCCRARSTDGGKTWTQEGLLHDPAGEGRRYSYHGPFLSRLKDGALLIHAMRIDRSDPQKPLFNEKTGGIVRSDTILMRSKDSGATWTKPQLLQTPPDLVLTPSCPVVELRDGRLFQAFDQWHEFDSPGPYRPRTVALFSSDGGRSWGDPVTFGDGSAQGKGFWHGRIIRLRDDRLFTLFWSGDMKTSGALPLHWCVGDPAGREWSAPQPTNIPGQTNWPVDLGNGRMAVIYTVRETNPPGFFAALSEDGGRTWDLEKQVQVWDATARDKIGVSSIESYPRSHDTIAFGAPGAIVLGDGDILATFWCTEVSVTHIRYARLRLA